MTSQYSRDKYIFFNVTLLTFLSNLRKLGTKNTFSNYFLWVISCYTKIINKRLKEAISVLLEP